MARVISAREVALEYKHAVLHEYTGVVTVSELDPSHATETILFNDRPASFCSAGLNAAQDTVAINVGQEIHLYHLDDGKVSKLKGHTAAVESLAFSPTGNTLVSEARPPDYGHDNEEPVSEVIMWNTDDLGDEEAGGIAGEAELKQMGAKGVTAVQEELIRRNLSLRLSVEEETGMVQAMANLLDRYQTQRRVAPENRLIGRLATSFGSQTFSPDGRKVIYLPGPEPRSNGDDQWDISVYDLNGRSTTTLVGHRDSVMSTMFSPDMRSIATVAWDETVRIWDAASGVQRHVFQTGQQNWAGVFSPDSRFFLATTGDGTVRIWNVVSGEKKWEWNYGTWCRAVDWSSDERWLAIGGEHRGRLVIFEIADPDLENPPALRHDRSLGEQAAEDDASPFGHIRARMLEVQRVKLLPATTGGGVKVASITTIDQAVEVFDLDNGKKWRIKAKGGDNVQCGAEFFWLEKKGELLTIARDGIRTWKLE